MRNSLNFRKWISRKFQDFSNFWRWILSFNLKLWRNLGVKTRQIGQITEQLSCFSSLSLDFATIFSDSEFLRLSSFFILFQGTPVTLFISRLLANQRWEISKIKTKFLSFLKIKLLHQFLNQSATRISKIETNQIQNKVSQFRKSGIKAESALFDESQKSRWKCKSDWFFYLSKDKKPSSFLDLLNCELTGFWRYENCFLCCCTFPWRRWWLC